MILPFCLLLLLSPAHANTETIVFQVPNYYDIPHHRALYAGKSHLWLNSTTRVWTHYPILNAYNYNLLETIVDVPYDYNTQKEHQVLVKLNNYGDGTFTSNDMINVKVCWPATEPINFDLDHRYIQASDLGLAPKGLQLDTLDIYIVVKYQADFYAVNPVPNSHLEFYLVVSRLPSIIPIPVELYDVIIYVVDVSIVAAVLAPYVARWVAELVG